MPPFNNTETDGEDFLESRVLHEVTFALREFTIWQN
jgi:hypothetical protein